MRLLSGRGSVHALRPRSASSSRWRRPRPWLHSSVVPTPKSVESHSRSVVPTCRSVECLPNSVVPTWRSVQCLPNSVVPTCRSVQCLPDSVDPTCRSVQCLPNSVVPTCRSGERLAIPRRSSRKPRRSARLAASSARETLPAPAPPRDASICTAPCASTPTTTKVASASCATAAAPPSRLNASRSSTTSASPPTRLAPRPHAIRATKPRSPSGTLALRGRHADVRPRARDHAVWSSIPRRVSTPLRT